MPTHEDYMLPKPTKNISEIVIKKIFREIEKECSLCDFFNSLLVCRKDSNIWKQYGAQLAPFAPGILLAFSHEEKVVVASAKVLSSQTKTKHPQLATILEGIVPDVLGSLRDVEWLVKWCFEKTQTTLKKELVALSSEDFVKGNATKGKVKDVQDFNMGILASKYQEKAPMNWALERSLMDATDSSRRLRDQRRKERMRGEVHQKDGDTIPQLRPTLEQPQDSDDDSDDEENYDSADDLDDAVLELLPQKDSLGKKRRRINDPVDTYHSLCDLKAVVSLSIKLHSTNQKSNFFQVVFGMYLKACGATEDSLQVLAHCGLSVSMESLRKLQKSIGEDLEGYIKRLCATFLAVIVYDNVNLPVRVAESTLLKDSTFHNLTAATFIGLHGAVAASLKLTGYMWSINPKNPSRTLEAIEKHVEPSYPALMESAVKKGLRPFEVVRTEIKLQILRILVETYPELAHLKPALQEYRSKSDVFLLECRKSIPLPARAMDEDEGTLEGNAAVLSNLRRQGAFTEEQGDYITIIHADLATIQSIDSLQLSLRCEDTSPTSMLKYVVAVPGIFHLVAAMGDALRRIHLAIREVPDVTSTFFNLAAMARPRMVGKFFSDPPYRLMQHLISILTTASIRDCAEISVPGEDWPAFLASGPKLKDLISLADDIHEKHVAIENAESKSVAKSNSKQLHRNGLLFLAAHHAMKTGDVGRLENLIIMFIPIFKAVGKHKYADIMLEFLVNLRCNWPPALADIIRQNWLVNLLGLPGDWMGFDMLQELHNKKHKQSAGDGSNRSVAHLIKTSTLIRFCSDTVKLFNSAFRNRNTTRRHKTPDSSTLVKQIQERIHAKGLNTDSPARECSFHHRVIDAFVNGLKSLVKINVKKPLHGFKAGTKVLLPIEETDMDPHGIELEMDTLPDSEMVSLLNAVETVMELLPETFDFEMDGDDNAMIIDS